MALKLRGTRREGLVTEVPNRVQGQNLGRRTEDEVSQKLKHFY